MHSSCLPAIFAKNRENFKRELLLNVVFAFSIIVCCLYLMVQKRILNKPKWGHKQSLGGTRPPVATALPPCKRGLSGAELAKDFVPSFVDFFFGEMLFCTSVTQGFKISRKRLGVESASCYSTWLLLVFCQLGDFLNFFLSFVQGFHSNTISCRR